MIKTISWLGGGEGSCFTTSRSRMYLKILACDPLVSLVIPWKYMQRRGLQLCLLSIRHTSHTELLEENNFLIIFPFRFLSLFLNFFILTFYITFPFVFISHFPSSTVSCFPVVFPTLTTPGQDKGKTTKKNTTESYDQNIIIRICILYKTFVPIFRCEATSTDVTYVRYSSQLALSAYRSSQHLFFSYGKNLVSLKNFLLQILILKKYTLCN